jgi:hypothetical protein
MGTRILLTSAVRSARPSGVAGGRAGTQGACLRALLRPSREEPPDVRRAQHREPAARRCLRTATRAISSAAAPSLAVGEGRWIVYPVDTDIRVLNTRRNRVRILATLAHPPRQVLALRGRAIWLAGTGTRTVAIPLS